VLADAGRGDRILCQITSKPYADSETVALPEESFDDGSLQRTSYARPGKLFTASSELVHGRVGRLKPEALRSIVDAVVAILLRGLERK